MIDEESDWVAAQRLPLPLRETASEVSSRTAVAWGDADPDLVVGGGTVLAPTGELLRLDIGIVGRRIAVLAEEIVAPGARRIDAAGKIIVPGYADSHTHGIGPQSPGVYLGEGLVRGVSYVTCDDAYVYSMLTQDGYRRMLALSDVVPMVLRWSLRPEPQPRRLTRPEALQLVAECAQISQVGELATYPEVRGLDDELASLLAGARNAGAHVEGHNPGASARTVGVAAAAGVTADHEAISAAEVIARLRLGVWAFIRHNGLRPDLPDIIPELLESGVSLERTGLTVDGPTPAWIAQHGLLDAAIRVAMQAGLPPREAYAMASWRPAAYLGLSGHMGAIAPGRIASFNVLGDLSEPRPERVFSLGAEVAREGRLLVEMPDVPWDELDPPPWCTRRERIPETAYRLTADDPVVTLESQAIVRLGGAAGATTACVAFDPVSERMVRAAMHGWPRGLLGFASTVTPERLLVVVGSSPAAMKRCVDRVFDVGGGLAYETADGLRALPLPVGGVISEAPFSEISSFYVELGEVVRKLGHRFPEPATTLLFIADDGLPGARFVADGLRDVRRGALIKASEAVSWE